MLDALHIYTAVTAVHTGNEKRHSFEQSTCEDLTQMWSTKTIGIESVTRLKVSEGVNSNCQDIY